MKMCTYNKLFIYQAAYSLLEVLITMALGLILMAMLMHIVLWQQDIHRQITDIDYLETNGRLAMHILGEEIQTAGYAGCARLRADLITSSLPQINFTMDNALQIIPADAYGNNQIRIQKMATVSLPLASGDVVVVADCQHINIAFYDGRHKNDYANKQVNAFIDETFLVDNTQRKSSQGKPIFALYQVLDSYQARKEPRVELVEGIQQLHAEPIVNQQGNTVAVKLTVQMVAPYGMTEQWQGIYTLREKII